MTKVRDYDLVTKEPGDADWVDPTEEFDPEPTISIDRDAHSLRARGVLAYGSPDCDRIILDDLDYHPIDDAFTAVLGSGLAGLDQYCTSVLAHGAYELTVGFRFGLPAEMTIIEQNENGVDTTVTVRPS